MKPTKIGKVLTTFLRFIILSWTADSYDNDNDKLNANRLTLTSLTRSCAGHMRSLRFDRTF